MKIKLLCLFILLQVPGYAQQQWRPLGPDDFNQVSYDQTESISVAIDENNIPHMAFVDLESGIYKVSVRKFVDGQWEYIGLPRFSENVALQPVSLVIDNNNVPYVAYRTAAGAGKIQKFLGGVWTNIAITESFKLPQLVFDPQGNLHLLAIFGTSEHAGLRKYNGTAWSTVGPASISNGFTDYFSAAFDSDGIPYVAYSNIAFGGRLTVKRFNNSVWQNVGDNLLSSDDAEDITLRLNSSNTPYVVYQNNNFFYPATIVKMFNDVQWVTVGPDAGAVATNVKKVSFAIDQDDSPVVATSNESSASTTIRRFDGNSWVLIGEPWLHGNTNAMVIDNTNIPLVGFTDNLAGMKRFDGTQWNILGAESLSGNSLSEYFSMTIAADNTPYMAFHTKGDTDIKVWKWNGQLWENLSDETLTATQSVPLTMTTDANNIPYVLYRNWNTNKLSVKKLIAGNWVFVGAEAFTTIEDGTMDAHLVIDGSGVLYVAIKSVYDNVTKLKFYKNAGANWVLMNFDLAIHSTSDINFTIGNDNRPLVVYTDANVTGKLAVRKLDATGTLWELVGSGIQLPDNPAYSYIAVNSQNVPYVSYAGYDGTMAVGVYRFWAGSWEAVGANLPSQFIEHPRVVTDNNEVPYLTYYDRDAENMGKMTVRKLNQSSWDLVGSAKFSASVSNQLAAPFVGFTSNNVPVIGYSCLGYFSKFFGEADALLDVREPQQDLGVLLYPNPAATLLHISTDQAIDRIAIYDLTGKKLNLNRFSDKAVDISSLQHGVYILEIQTGAQKYSRRFVKQ